MVVFVSGFVCVCMCDVPNENSGKDVSQGLVPLPLPHHDRRYSEGGTEEGYTLCQVDIMKGKRGA